MERLLDRLNQFQKNKDAMVTIKLKHKAQELSCALKFIFIDEHFVSIPEYNQYKMIPIVNIEQISFPTDMVDIITKEII